ncbi:MAG TPA: hypothetical protein VK447_10975 [Myxococcaceae bacterium]|nr:hypothetical protein [Myxococcaceae bacterium]
MKSFVSLALLLGVLGWGRAEAQTHTAYRFKSEYGSTYCYKQEGCLTTDVYVFATEEAYREGRGKPPPASTYLSVSYSTYNSCTGEFIGSWYGVSTTATVNGNPSNLTASGTVPIYNYETGAIEYVDVNLALTANGAYRSHYVSNYQYNTPHYRYRYRSVGSSVDADVRGSVVMNGTDLLAGMTCSANIGTSKSGSIEFYRN